MPDRIAPVVSDADQTLELPSADQTVTDFVPVRVRAVAAAIVASEVEVDLQDLSADAVIDGTQELGGADVLEVEQVAARLHADDKLEISMDAKNKDLTEVFGALSLRKPQKTLVGVGVSRSVPRPPPPIVDTRSLPVMLPPSGPVETIDTLPILVPTFRPPQPSFAPLPPPRSPSRYPSQPSHHPSSISPLALDIGAEAAPIESTAQIRRAAGIPDRARPEVAIVAGIAAWAVMAASVVLVLGGTFVGIKHHAAAKASAAAALAAPLPPVSSGVVEAAPNVPPPVVERAAPEAVAAKPASPVPAAVALPQPHPRGATPPRAPAKPAGIAGAQTGVLRVPAGVKGVLVDGAPRKVDGGALFLPCGKHMIKAPGQASRSVDIVCGKTVTL